MVLDKTFYSPNSKIKDSKFLKFLEFVFISISGVSEQHLIGSWTAAALWLRACAC